VPHNALELDRYRELKTEAETRRRDNLLPAAERANSPPRGKTRDKVAAWVGVSPRTVQDAVTVQQHDPDLFERIKAGELAADLAARKVRRAFRDANLPAAPPLPEGPFELIYADPPWQLGNPDGVNAPENHYPTMALEEIKELQPPAADNAVLFLWAVNCLLPEALEVIDTWGFTYKTNLVWFKPSIGLGRWTRNRHELLLFATRGRIELPNPDQVPDSVIEAGRGRHSQKPGCVYELIERAYPHLSKLELFARGTPRPGWHAWGNETSDTRPDGRWTAPDLAWARRLIAASGTRGERITVWGDKTANPLGTSVVRYTVHLLRRLGYRASARIVRPSVWERHPQVFRKMQLISAGWANGSTFEFVDDVLACAAPNNTHFFCDHRLDKAFHEANTLEAKDPRAAGIQWAQIDHQLVDQAAWVPLVNIRRVDFVSDRVRNYEADPTLGLIADQVWLR
jgi:N6-adenosine-specific RNA methylase IME4